ncbi:MAG: hypothetical protein HFF18_10265 [Oscillospiraceae bacterium]|nr:hypothetical protein [Oscillospiraceae bacterium]
MGMSDSQFKSFIRFLLLALKDMLSETDPEKKKAKMDEILNNLQKALED